MEYWSKYRTYKDDSNRVKFVSFDSPMKLKIQAIDLLNPIDKVAYYNPSLASTHSLDLLFCSTELKLKEILDAYAPRQDANVVIYFHGFDYLKASVILADYTRVAMGIWVACMARPDLINAKDYLRSYEEH